MGKHHWMEYHGLMSCRHCGIVKQRDGNNKPCPGKVRIALRENRVKTGAFGEACPTPTDLAEGES